MAGIARQSKYHGPFLQVESPLLLPHASWVGLSVLVENDNTVLTVDADFSIDGEFENSVDMLGDGTKFRYPDCSNLLYNAGYIRLTWNSGAIQVLQKG
jgi:hypothetical protein